MSIAPHLPLQALVGTHVRRFDTAEQKFMTLADAWLDHQAGRSTLDLLHPAHQQIVGMGEAAVPFLLREVEQQTGFWFAALKAITGDSPVPQAVTADFDAAARAWLQWGQRHGYWSGEDGTGRVVGGEPVAPR